MTASDQPVPVQLWLAFEARVWERAAALLHDDFVAEWPVSNERFVGRDKFIGMNRAYPGDWHINVERVVDNGETVVTHVRVNIGPEISHAISFFDLKDGQIIKAVDWWPEPYDPPDWRKGWAEPLRG